MTAEEFEEQNCNKYDSYSSMMRDFARFHVKEALNIAAIQIEKSIKSNESFGRSLPSYAAKEKILNAYPLENIK